MNLRGRGVGFTLLELMVVVALISVLAAVSIIQLGRARVTAFEQLAIASLRNMSQACQQFYVTHQAYPATLTALGSPAVVPPYLRPDLIGNGTTATKQGYTFTYAQGAGGSSFTVLANPVTAGVTGSRHFFVDESLIIRVDGAGPADAADPPLS